MWEGKPELSAPTLEDGREVKNVIADGKRAVIPFPIWFERSTYSRGKRRGDILWGGPPTLVSRRFAQAVEELGVTGCSTYEVDLYSLNEGKVEGYIGFAENTRGTSEIRSYAWPEKHHSYAWIISERVPTGLHERGIDMFDVKESSQKNHASPHCQTHPRRNALAPPRRLILPLPRSSPREPQIASTLSV